MTKTRKTISLLLAVVMMLSVFTGLGITAMAEPADIGWTDDGKYINIHNEVAKGWFHEEGERYYWCYSDPETGVGAKGWLQIKNKWYYFGEDHRAYMNTSYKIGNKIYAFDKNCAMLDKTGWAKDGFGNWYYLKQGGAAYTGWKKISGKWYYFRTDSGQMISGNSAIIGGKLYLFSSSGAMKSNGWATLADGVSRSDKYVIWYYLNSDGSAVSGWKKISGKWYYFDKNGYEAYMMATGWMKIKGKWYYFDEDKNGAMLANTSKKIGSKTYRFNSSGVCTNP